MAASSSAPQHHSWGSLLAYNLYYNYPANMALHLIFHELNLHHELYDTVSIDGDDHALSNTDG